MTPSVVEYYIANKRDVFKEHLIMGKTLLVKVKKIWRQFSTFCVILMRCMCLHMLKSGFVLFTAGCVTPELVLSRYLLNECFCS